MDFELLLFGQFNLRNEGNRSIKSTTFKGHQITCQKPTEGHTYISEKLANVLALITLQLNYFTILRVLNHSPIAGKFLKMQIRGKKVKTAPPMQL